MKSTLFKYLLSLCTILGVATGHLYAAGTGVLDTDTFESSEHLSNPAQAAQAFIISAPLSGRHHDISFEATESEVEEDEVVSSKKLLSGSHSTASTSTQLSMVVCHAHVNSLAAARSFSDFTYHRWYVLFRVFRL